MITWKEIWDFTENDKWLRVLIATIFALIIIFLIWVWFKAFIIKPKVVAQTVSGHTDSLSKRITSIDTSTTVPLTTEPKKQVTPEKVRTTKKTATKEEIKMDNKEKNTDTGNVEVNTNNGINKGNIGGRDNTVNNYGIQPRIIGEDLIDRFSAHFPDKERQVSFMAFGGTSAEIESVRLQITKILKSRGYIKIDDYTKIKIGDPLPPRIQYGPNGAGGVTFYIPPATE